MSAYPPHARTKPYAQMVLAPTLARAQTAGVGTTVNLNWMNAFPTRVETVLLAPTSTLHTFAPASRVILARTASKTPMSAFLSHAPTVRTAWNQTNFG